MYSIHKLNKHVRVIKLRSIYTSISDNTDFQSIHTKNYVKLTAFQKILLLVGCPVQFFILDHKRPDLLACMGELTSNAALFKLLAAMQKHPEGRKIVKDKPLINSKTMKMDFLRNLPKDTLGRDYFEFMTKYNLSPDDRENVKFIDNLEIAYVMARYRQSHDLVHTVVNLPPNKIGEICIKCIEAASTGIPLCYTAPILGPLFLNKQQLRLYKKYYSPWAIKNSLSLSFPLVFVYWEERWKQNIADLRNELGIIPFDEQIIR